MQAQWYLIRAWTIISLQLSQLIPSRTVQCCLPCVVLVALITFGGYLLSMFNFSTLGISAFYLLNKVSFGEPFPISA